MGARTRVAVLQDGAELWREVGTDRWWLHERVEGESFSTSVRDLRRRVSVGEHATAREAAMAIDGGMNR